MNIPSSALRSPAWSLPLVGYSRLTHDREGIKHGHEVQTTASEAWAKELGRPIGRWFRDTDLTAADEDVWRPQYEEMLAEVEAGMWGGIVVWRVDRLTRLTGQFERVLKILGPPSRGRGLFASDRRMCSLDPNDLKIMRLDAWSAQNEVDDMKTRSRASVSRRTVAGEYLGGGRRPYGFVGPEYETRQVWKPDGQLGTTKRVINSGKCGIEHVPEEAEHLRDAARRIAWEGESAADVVRDWNSRKPPILGATGAPWATKTLETILTSHRIVGQVATENVLTGKLEVVTAKWAPILDEATWHQLRHVLRHATAWRTPRKRGRKSTYPLSGVLRCGRCDYPLTGSLRKRHDTKLEVRTYRCPSNAPDKARGACGKLSVVADDVERLVYAWIVVRLEKSPEIGESITERNERELELAELLRERQAVKAMQVEYAEQVGAGELGPDEWQAMRRPLAARIKEIDHRVQALRAAARTPVPLGDERKNIATWLESLTETQRRDVLDSHVERIEVAPTRSGRYFDPRRVTVTPRRRS